MTSGPPENPPVENFNLPLVQDFPPHGFPPYLGLGWLNTDSIHQAPGESIAEYRVGDDLVYRLRGTFDPEENPGVSTACGATNATWDIEEFFGGKPWRKTSGYQTLSQVFFHHHAEQLPTENPRIAEVFRRLTDDHHVALRCKNACSYLMFPAGYVYAIRLPLTEETLENLKKLLSEGLDDDLPAPWPRADNPQSVAIIKADHNFQVTFERGAVCDMTVALIRLTQTLDRLQAAKAIAGPVHLRPEVLYAHERHRKYSQVYPGRLRDGVMAYEVIPIDDDMPHLEELAQVFAVDAFDLFTLIDEALQWNARSSTDSGGDYANN